MKTEDTDTPYPGRWRALGVLAAGFALPTMIGARDLSLTNAQWVNAIYNVIFAALMLGAGRGLRALGSLVDRLLRAVLGAGGCWVP